MFCRRFSAALLLAATAACGGRPSQIPPGPDWAQYVLIRPGTEGNLDTLSWRPGVCAGVELRPDYRTLNESSIVSFLRDQNFAVRVERQPVEARRPDLVFIFVQVPGAAESIPLRVAMLPSADEAGRSLYDALLVRGSRVWGIHRSNVAVLGPQGASFHDDLAFAAKTKLACWGTFTTTDGSNAFVIPGGYAEP